MEGWRARCTATRPGLPWVMPSPNMPTLDTAIVYPGTVLFEGTLLSEGRGTTRPFELVGAPWIDAERFAARHERARSGRRLLPAGGVRADVPEAREDRRAAAARFTCSTAPRSARARPRPRCCSRCSAQIRRSSSGAQPPYEYETTRCRSTSSPGLRRCASRSKVRSRSRTLSRAGESGVAALRGHEGPIPDVLNGEPELQSGPVGHLPHSTRPPDLIGVVVRVRRIISSHRVTL